MNPRQQQLPSKVCVVCRRAFTWRKKWERDWANVRYCSKRCAAMGRRAGDGGFGDEVPRGEAR